VLNPLISVAGAASEAFVRWLHCRYAAAVGETYVSPRDTLIVAVPLPTLQFSLYFTDIISLELISIKLRL